MHANWRRGLTLKLCEILTLWTQDIIFLDRNSRNEMCPLNTLFDPFRENDWEYILALCSSQPFDLCPLTSLALGVGGGPGCRAPFRSCAEAPVPWLSSPSSVHTSTFLTATRTDAALWCSAQPRATDFLALLAFTLNMLPSTSACSTWSWNTFFFF